MSKKSVFIEVQVARARTSRPKGESFWFTLEFDAQSFISKMQRLGDFVITRKTHLTDEGKQNEG